MTHHLTDTTGIRPVSALLTMGRKGKTGAPTERDRWHVTTPELRRVTFRSRSGKEYGGEVHDPHPDFGAWHEARPEDRRTVTIEIEQATWDDAATIGRARQQTPQGRDADDGRPWCSTTAPHEASRLGDKGHRMTVRCPGDSCPHARSEDPRRCRPVVDLRGRIVWDDTPFAGRLPSVSVRWRSRGWRSVRGIMGVREEMDRLWAALVVQTTGMSELAGKDWPTVQRVTGFPSYTTHGLRLRLRLTETASKGRVFPVVMADTLEPLSVWLKSHGARMMEIRRMMADAQPSTLALPDYSTGADPVVVPPCDGGIAPPSADDVTGRARVALDALSAIGVHREDAEHEVGKPAPDWTDADLDGPVAMLFRMARGGAE